MNCATRLSQSHINEENRNSVDEKLDLIEGTLDLTVLRTLETGGSQHVYCIPRHIEQVSGNEVLPNQGTIDAALVRLLDAPNRFFI
jgi:DNA-binding PadR family transcriptional regulator